MKLRALIVAAVVLGVGVTRAADNPITKALHTILPTPTPAKRHHSTPSPTPAKISTPRPTATVSTERKDSPTPAAATTPKGKHRKHTNVIPTPTPSPTATAPRKSPVATPSPTEAPTSPSPTPTPPPRNAAGSTSAPNVALPPDRIDGFGNYPPNIQKLLGSALDLTSKNLTYKYGSADPANGGMDCSGFIYYVLKQNGVNDPPRDSAGQYLWLRKMNRFAAVVSRHDDSPELADLRPGDLLFWTGTYKIDRDPPITHVMIYVGREKDTGKRVMVGSSDGRTYDGVQRWGVSVFDFKIPQMSQRDLGAYPVFVGYGRLPGVDWPVNVSSAGR